MMVYQCWDGEPVVGPQFNILRSPGVESQGNDGGTYWRPYGTSCYHERSREPFASHFSVLTSWVTCMYDEFREVLRAAPDVSRM